MQSVRFDCSDAIGKFLFFVFFFVFLFLFFVFFVLVYHTEDRIR